jgi:hypothetical protein
MKKRTVDKAERIAQNVFDKWNEVTGFVDEADSYYDEIQGLMIDAVHIGIQMTINGKVAFDEYGDVQIGSDAREEKSDISYEQMMSVLKTTSSGRQVAYKIHPADMDTPLLELGVTSPGGGMQHFLRGEEITQRELIEILKNAPIPERF